MNTRDVAAITAAAILTSTTAADVVIWSESVHGDISGDRLNPTAVTLSPGVNTLIATSLTGDREYMRMTIPGGLHLQSIINITWESEDPIGFIAVQQGPTFTEPPTGTNVANLLGWTHFGSGPGTVGLDILPAIGAGAGAIGFTPPLTGGTYTFWMQQTGPLPATYRLDFVVVPSPGALASAVLALGCVIRRRRGRL